MNRLASIALPLRTLRCVSNTSSKLLVSINPVKLSASQFSSVSTHSKSNNSNNHNVSKPMKAIVLNKTGPLENLEYLKDVPRPSYTSTEVKLRNKKKKKKKNGLDDSYFISFPISKYFIKLFPILSKKKVLVKVSACAVCHRDLLDRQGAFPFIRTPVIPG